MIYWETENDFIIEEIFLPTAEKKYFSAKSMRYHMIKYKPNFKMNTKLLGELKLKETRLLRELKLKELGI